MGGSLLSPSSSNPKGYFESAEVNHLNDELITAVTAVRPSGPLGYLYPWRLSPGLLWFADIDINTSVRPTHEQLELMETLSSTKPFCFKDPRFCYTLDAWRSVLDDAVFLCVFREPGRTVTSIKKDVREQYPRERYRNFHLTNGHMFGAWISMYTHVLEKHSREGHWIFIHYDQIVDGSAVPKIESAINAKVDASFVDPALKRSRDTDKLPGAVTPVYQRLCALAGYVDSTLAAQPSGG